MKNESLFSKPCPILVGSPCTKPQMMMLLKTRHKAKTLLSNQTPSGLSVHFQNFFWMDMLSKRKFFEVVFTKTGLVNRWKMHILVCCINQRTKTEFYSKGNLLIMAMGSWKNPTFTRDCLKDQWVSYWDLLVNLRRIRRIDQRCKAKDRSRNMAPNLITSLI